MCERRARLEQLATERRGQVTGGHTRTRTHTRRTRAAHARVPGRMRLRNRPEGRRPQAGGEGGHGERPPLLRVQTGAHGGAGVAPEPPGRPRHEPWGVRPREMPAQAGVTAQLGSVHGGDSRPERGTAGRERAGWPAWEGGRGAGLRAGSPRSPSVERRRTPSEGGTRRRIRAGEPRRQRAHLPVTLGGHAPQPRAAQNPREGAERPRPRDVRVHRRARHTRPPRPRGARTPTALTEPRVLWTDRTTRTPARRGERTDDTLSAGHGSTRPRRVGRAGDDADKGAQALGIGR